MLRSAKILVQTVLVLKFSLVPKSIRISVDIASMFHTMQCYTGTKIFCGKYENSVCRIEQLRV